MYWKAVVAVVVLCLWPISRLTPLCVCWLLWCCEVQVKDSLTEADLVVLPFEALIRAISDAGATVPELQDGWAPLTGACGVTLNDSRSSVVEMRDTVHAVFGEAFPAAALALGYMMFTVRSRFTIAYNSDNLLAYGACWLCLCAILYCY